MTQKATIMHWYYYHNDTSQLFDKVNNSLSVLEINTYVTAHFLPHGGKEKRKEEKERPTIAKGFMDIPIIL